MNENPVQKRSMILTHLTYFLIVLLIAAIGLYTYWVTKAPSIDYTEDFRIPSVSVISPQEAQDERQKIISMVEPITIVSEEISETDSETEERDSSSSGIGQKSSYLVDPSNVNSKTDSSKNSNSPVPPADYIAAGSGLTLTSKTSEMTYTQNLSQAIEGSIYAIDENAGTILIALKDDSGLRTIKTNKDTIYYINGKNITFSDFRVADVIKVEGRGSFGSGDLVASVIVIKSYLQVIPTT